MDAIRSYIENVFANLPRTDAVLKAKSDMLANMEEKYQELKREGHSENEAVGKVISEFGNIDELLSGLRVSPASSAAEPKSVYRVTKQEADEWISHKRRSGLLTAIGVFLCIAGAAALIFITAGPGRLDSLPFTLQPDANPALGITVMLIMVAVAVGLFIYAGVRLEKFNFFKKDFELMATLQARVEEQKGEFMRSYTVSLILGVILCILAPLVIILPLVLFQSGDHIILLVTGMLMLIGIASFLFTYFGSVKDAYDRLLKQGDHEDEFEGSGNKLVSAVSSVIWPLAVIIFLLNGFLGNRWGTAWIVFPVTALAFTAFSAVARTLGKNKK